MRNTYKEWMTERKEVRNMDGWKDRLQAKHKDAKQ